ncbi:MAG: epoxyqueuosine reductase QueH [Candidatus Woesearchaeota archaeon]
MQQEKPLLVLHSCCGPCSTTAIARLKEQYQVVAFFYNPNIHPKNEYKRRLEEAKKVYDFYKIPCIVGIYEPKEWFFLTKGLEQEPEGQERCKQCYWLRLKATIVFAKEKHIKYCTTSLTLSPHHKTATINQIGKEVAMPAQEIFLEQNFKKQDGFLFSVQQSKVLGLYRQEYCGCMPSFLKWQQKKANTKQEE